MNLFLSRVMKNFHFTDFNICRYPRQGLLKDGQESSSKIFKLFSVKKYPKREMKIFVAMPNVSNS